MSNESDMVRVESRTFLKKVASFGKIMGFGLVQKTVAMYFALRDGDTPKWAKTVIVGSLAYFVFPADAIPDFIPGAGLTDDTGALLAAFATVAMYIKKEHHEKAREKCRAWFGHR